MPELDWVHLTTQEIKRKRPEHVCGICHSKKIKCDLQARSANGHSKCTNCEANGRDCRVRAPKRAKTTQQWSGEQAQGKLSYTLLLFEKQLTP
jgi:hypothetical protein